MSNFLYLANVESFGNNDITTLSGPVASSDTTISVASVSGFPLDGQFRLLIDSELLLVTAVDVEDNLFLVSRGQEGTTAASHISGAQVYCILTKGALTKLKYDSGKVYTYREGWPLAAQMGNVYATFDGAFQAAIDDTPSTIFIDNTLSQNSVVGNSTGFQATVSSAVGSTVTITGLTGMVPRVVGLSLGIFNAANAGNNGLFPITAVLSPTSVQVTNASAVVGDVNVSWDLVDGATAALTAGPSNLVLITGLTLGTGYNAQGAINPSMVGQTLTFANAGNAGNDGTFTIFAFVSSSAVMIQNASAVANDGANWITDSGSTASIVAFDNVHGNVEITGLSGITDAMVGYNIIVSGSAANDGQFTIERVLSATSLTYRNFGGSAPDANNGAISWKVSQSNPSITQINVPTVTASGLVNVGAQTGNAFVFGNSGVNVSNYAAAILAWVNNTTVLLNPVNLTGFTLPDPNNGSLWWHIGDDYDLSLITLTSASFTGSTATLNIQDGVTFNEGIQAITGGLRVQGNYNVQAYGGTLGISMFGYYNSTLLVSDAAQIVNDNTQAMFDLSFIPVNYNLVLEDQANADQFGWLGAQSNSSVNVTIYSGGNIGNHFVAGTAGALAIAVFDTTVTPPTSYSGFYGTPGTGIYITYSAKAATLQPFAHDGNPTPNIEGEFAAGAYNVQEGTMYFDTGLLQPFWYTGEAWVSYPAVSSLAVGFGRATPLTPSDNIVAQQITHASAFAGDSTNVGVVLLGSDSHGNFNNINANYIGFLSGDGAIITAPYSVIAGGYENSIQGTTSQGYDAIVGGQSNSINETDGYSFIGGGQANNLATAEGWNVIGGGYSNSITSPYPVYGHVIAGGSNNAITGGPGSQNTIGGGYQNSIVGTTSLGPVASIIGGGYFNIIGSTTFPNAVYSTIGGGEENSIYDSYATIGGGLENIINSGATYGTIAGGQANTLTTAAVNGTIGGGESNTVNDEFATIVGGASNQVNNGEYAFIGGGQSNYIAGRWATIGGGFTNEIFGDYAVIGGGSDNIAGNEWAFVGGGSTNHIVDAEGAAGFIGGGQSNTISTGANNVITGGTGNQVVAGNEQVIGGGSGNTITGGNSGNPNSNTIAGGTGNNIGSVSPDIGFGTIGGGNSHSVQANFGTVAGGNANTVTGAASFVGGGASNEVDADHGGIVGGQNNIVTAGTGGFIGAGRQNQVSGNNASALGVQGSAPVDGSTVMASGSFNAVNGSSQLMEVQFRVATANIGTFPLGTGDDGTGNTTQSTLFLPTNAVFNITVDGVAMCPVTNISYKAWTTRLVVQTISSSTPTVLDQTDILAPYGTGPNAAGWSFSMVGTGANALQINFTTGATDNTFVTLNLRIVQLAPPLPS